MNRFPEAPGGASGAWTQDNVFTSRICFDETPFFVTVKRQFGESEVKLNSETNVGFGMTKEADLVGKLP